jgi:DNA-binding LacI/PurR family transcriptional regulator
MIGSELNLGQALLDVLRQRFELRVPDDISVVGTQIDAGTGANMTRIEMPYAEVGRGGAALLQEIAAQPKTVPRRLLIAPKIVEGWSCRRLSNGQPASGSPAS